ncbi:hypothetical protein Tco_0900947 [Tanacetum coccineum]
MVVTRKDFSSRVTPLFPTMVVQAQEEIVSSEEASLGDQEDASKQGRKIDDIDVDEDITLENVHDADMFGVNDLDGDEVVVEISSATITNVELTLDQILAELKSQDPRQKELL